MPAPRPRAVACAASSAVGTSAATAATATSALLLLLGLDRRIGNHHAATIAVVAVVAEGLEQACADPLAGHLHEPE